MQATLDSIKNEAFEALNSARNSAELGEVEKRYTGKTGPIAEILKSVPTLPAEERPLVGKAANLLKRELLAEIEARSQALAAAALAAEREDPFFDPTLPAPPMSRGTLHPVTQMRREVEDLFCSMGYTVLDGPEVESDFYNFQALNFPDHHPARDIQDTFWCDVARTILLRTHTSPVQVRAMQSIQPPIRAIVPGRVFRNEAIDASHEHTFHQVEGLGRRREPACGKSNLLSQESLTRRIAQRHRHSIATRLFPLRRTRFRGRYSSSTSRRRGWRQASE